MGSRLAVGLVGGSLLLRFLVFNTYAGPLGALVGVGIAYAIEKQEGPERLTGYGRAYVATQPQQQAVPNRPKVEAEQPASVGIP